MSAYQVTPDGKVEVLRLSRRHRGIHARYTGTAYTLCGRLTSPLTGPITILEDRPPVTCRSCAATLRERKDLPW